MANHSRNRVLPHVNLQASEEEIEQNTRLLFHAIDTQITQTDSKAYLTIVAEAAIIFLLSEIEQQELRTLFLSTTMLTTRISALCIFLALLALLSSCYCAVLAVLPHVQDRDRITLLYFEHIAELGHDKFVSNFQNQPVQELKASLLSEIYAKARLARRKRSCLSWSVNLFFCALVFWFIAQLLLVV